MPKAVARNCRASNPLLFLTLLSSLVVAAAVWRTPQGVSRDASWQLRALQQYLAGSSPSPNHLVMPSRDDLSRDAAEWIVWWPPATQLLAYPPAAGGMPLGSAIRLVATTGFVLGSLGWVRWFSLFGLPRWLQAVLALGQPWTWYANGGFFTYSAETLVYAATPWALLATYMFGQALPSVERCPKRLLAFSVFTGLGLGLLSLLKYSAGFIWSGALLYLVLMACRRRGADRSELSAGPATSAAPGWRARALAPSRTAVAALAMTGVVSAMPTFALGALNRALGSAANIVAASAGVNLRWESFLYLVAYPALAIERGDMLWHRALSALSALAAPEPSAIDSGPAWQRALTSPAFYPDTSEPAVVLAGLPGGMLLLWLVLRRGAAQGPGLLAQAVFLTSLAAIYAVWSVSEGVSFEARHVAGGSMAVLPLALQEGTRLWGETRHVLRLILSAAALVYVALPIQAGAASVVAHVARAPRAYAAGPSGIYNPQLAARDLAAVRDRLVRDIYAGGDVWYLTEPTSALDLPGRVMIVDIESAGADGLPPGTYKTGSPVRIHALLPADFWESSSGTRLRSRFAQAGEWTTTPLDGSDYVVWTVTVGGSIDSDRPPIPLR